MTWYLFSTEGKRQGLPARCEVLSRAKTTDGREAVLVRCERSIPDYKGDTFLLVPRGKGEKFSGPHSKHDIVTTHIVAAETLSDSKIVDLTGARPIDWAAIAFNEDTVWRWSGE